MLMILVCVFQHIGSIPPNLHLCETQNAVLHSTVGYHMGICFIGALTFVDDLNLHSPTLSVLKLLVDVCEKYAEEYNINFNNSKSRLLLFKVRRCKVSNRGIIVNGVLLNMSELAVHLEHHVCIIMTRSGVGVQQNPADGSHLICLCHNTVIFIPFSMVSYLCNTVVAIIVHHYGHLVVASSILYV